MEGERQVPNGKVLEEICSNGDLTVCIVVDISCS